LYRSKFFDDEFDFLGLVPGYPDEDEAQLCHACPRLLDYSSSASEFRTQSNKTILQVQFKFNIREKTSTYIPTVGNDNEITSVRSVGFIRNCFGM
jgi:hypothetical protein